MLHGIVGAGIICYVAKWRIQDPAMIAKKDCYGAIFPDLGRLELNKPLAGKALRALVESHGVGVSSRQVTVRPARTTGTATT